MYTTVNFKTKKSLKDALNRGQRIEVYQPNAIGTPQTDGPVTLEGPHFPEPHKWYATCTIKDSCIVPGTLK